MAKRTPGELQVRNEFALQQGTKNAEVVRLMAEKQEKMIELGWITEDDLRHVNRWHLMSAEMVIADLLRLLDGGRDPR